MKPLREIIIREYLPGSYEVECEGRVVSVPHRNYLSNAIADFTSEGGRGGFVSGFQDHARRPWEEPCA